MKEALQYDLIRGIYDRSAAYYDRLHNFGTYGLDERGRNILVRRIVRTGDYILDTGGGTGTTGLKAIHRAGTEGKVVILDFSKNMLDIARAKSGAAGLAGRVEFCEGDMYNIPFPENTFDVVLSTYSTCPLANPLSAVKEMIRVTKTGGFIGIAHSTASGNQIARQISSGIEWLLWKIPRLSLGCRNIDMMDGIKELDVEITENKIIGFIPFYFRLMILKKTDRSS